VLKCLLGVSIAGCLSSRAMGNKCGTLDQGSSEVRCEDIPAYPWQNFADGESSVPLERRDEVSVDAKTVLSRMSHSELPRLGLSPKHSMGMSLAKGSRLSLPKMLPSIGLSSQDDRSPMFFPLPVPGSSSPQKAISCASPKFFPVSSYMVSDAPVRKAARRVKFANSPTHSVHRSEFGIEPYSEVYGMHPREFDFNDVGDKIPCEANSRNLDLDGLGDTELADQLWKGRSMKHLRRQGSLEHLREAERQHIRYNRAKSGESFRDRMLPLEFGIVTHPPPTRFPEWGVVFRGSAYNRSEVAHNDGMF